MPSERRLRDGVSFVPGFGTEFAIKKTWDAEPAMKSAGMLREKQGRNWDETRHVARVPKELITHLCIEAGIKPTDRAAVQDLMWKKLMDGTLSKFRVAEGNY